jgi:hypothetical protein
MRRPTLALLAAALVLLALPAAPAQAAESPWWQLLTGSHPTNLPLAPTDTEVQELKTTRSEALSNSFAARVEVGGETVGCLGAGVYSGLCQPETGFAATSTAAGLKEMLEGSYGEDLEVTGGPVGGEPFLVATPGRWVAPLVLTPLLYEVEPGLAVPIGSAEAKVTSEGSGRLVITATNLGDAPLDAGSVPLTIADSLPAGVSAYGAEAFAAVRGAAGPVACAVKTTSLVECSFESELRPFEAIEVEIPVALQAGAGSEPGQVTISGGEGPGESVAPSESKAQPVNVSSDPVPFGLEYFSVEAEEEGGGEVRQAGAHPFQLTNTVQFDSGKLIPLGPFRNESVVQQPALPRNTGVTFPAGLVGSATAVETCSIADFFAQNEDLANACPASSAVGVASVTIIESQNLGFVRVPVPIFNLVPARGEPARFGFMPTGVPVVIDTSVDPSDSYRIAGEVRNAPQTAQVLAATLTLWGVPGDPRHDSSRGWECLPYTPGARAEETCPEPPAHRQVPFLRMPVSCNAQLEYRGLAEPWNAPAGSLADRPSFLAPPLSGCNRLPFDPTIENALTSKLASNPSGLDFELTLPNQWPSKANPGAITEAQPKKVEVTLPKGVSVNPSQAEGLATCSPADYKRERYDSRPGEGCPEASKIGSVEVSTPLLKEKASGALYVATPYENPTGAMIALYLVAKIRDRGILVKQAGKVEPDSRTGQLVSTFDDIPQLPFSSFKLHFREGGRSPLITPPGCGTFQTLARFTPWSAQDPDNPAPDEVVERSEATFTIDHGVDGGACPTGPTPFDPGFEAGTLNNQAGSYSPFLMRLTRKDGEQDMGRFSFVLPPGVVPKLAGIPYCSDQGIARAQSRQGPHGGAEERNDPSCPAASQIGRTVAGAGVGNQLTYVPGALYLAGPYHGDPISAVSITPAVAGPFDAGVVVVREALRLNPVSHVGEVDGSASDPIPHTLKGIPLNLRDLRVYADRPEFTLNATSCEPFAASSTIWGDGTALEPLGETPVTLSSRYQAAGCASLGFKPKLAIKLKGGTRRGAHPALKAVVTPRAGDANFSRAVVTLPHSAFLDQAHIRTICTRVQFNAGAGNGARCPKGAVYGHARAWTPLLSEPLEGPVFLRSSNHNLPDLVLALHGLVNIDLAARIDSVHGGIRSSFADVPDAPVSRFVLEMQGGRKGLIVNSTDLCQGAHRATANLRGQNGRLDRIKPVVRAAKCAKAKRKAHGKHRKKRKHRRGRHQSRRKRGGRR